MRSSLSILGLLANFAVAYNCSVTAIAAPLPAKFIVFYATHYDAGATFTTPPEYNVGGSLPGDAPGGAPGTPPGGNISLSATSQYSFGLALPDNWNGRFLTVGNGGFSGSDSWDSVIDGMWYRFASVSTDTGHESGRAEWAYNHPEALENWGYRAMHDTVLKGIAVTQGYYGTNISYSYYRGCSAGGKQGLKEVEMFPNEFDGVAAGAPAWWITHLQLWNMIVGIWNQPANCSHYIPPSMPTYLADGVISDQIATLNKLHSDWAEAGQFIFPSFTLGSEWGLNGLVSSPSPLGTTYVIYFYNQVAKALKPRGIKLDDFYKFYLVPGMGHCAMTYPKMNAPWVISGDGQAGGLTRTSHGVLGF
ncbi:hypothetical protein BHYA_0231g00080 [Botrytis hyacinthi]|uniref:Carboxylic ester hydrolase n=1 Tax=Botrytis hyacinthi TaxID=278943 RepID=A0A4Z1G9R0_9HELO|nr:hypothetical protein BHYA_0231g00080 [Botrytis hyacinthi]